MLTLPPTARVFVAAGATDMRKCFDTLAQVVHAVIREDPLSGHLFVFCNKRRNRLKILVWDGTGYWLHAKRLEKGTFAWPQIEKERAKLELDAADLALLLAGIDLRDVERRPWYRRPRQSAEGSRA